jgi:S-adenosylmethionine:tRNA ribosyltransferase-isomerase
VIPESVFAPATFARRASETRLLVIRVGAEDVLEAPFEHFARLLSPGDVVVVNDAATLPASVFGATARGEPIELRLLAMPDASGECDAVALGAGDYRTPTERRAPPPPLATGDALSISGLAARVTRVETERRVRVRFGDREDAVARLYRAGRPVQYTHVREPLALWDVQNVYAGEPWAAEMPSAGRPIDFAALDALRRRGVTVARLTHGAGLSSIGDAAMDASLPWVERYRIPRETAAYVSAARRDGRCVIAVGTSVVRALESAALATGEVSAGEATTDLRIDARHRLRAVSGLLTGMHDPTTSHAELLSAFAPRDLLARASAWAVSRGFLGHELGDSCLIVPA